MNTQNHIIIMTHFGIDDQPKVSNCCGAEPVSNGDMDSQDVEICPDCHEHCEYVNPDEQ